MTVDGTITNYAGMAGFIVHSDATGAGSLIHNTSDVDATVESYMQTLDTYHFIASPVTNALSAVFHYAWLYSWNEPHTVLG